MATIFHTLPPAALRYWRVLLLLSLLLYGALLAVFYGFFQHMPLVPELTGIMAGMAVFFTVAQWLYFTLRFRRTAFWLDARKVEVHLGVWFRHEIVLQRSRVQYVDVQQAPLSRRFGLATLVIFTAGSMLPAVRLPALALAQAEEIRRVLVDGHE